MVGSEHSYRFPREPGGEIVTVSRGVVVGDVAATGAAGALVGADSSISIADGSTQSMRSGSRAASFAPSTGWAAAAVETSQGCTGARLSARLSSEIRCWLDYSWCRWSDRGKGGRE